MERMQLISITKQSWIQMTVNNRKNFKDPIAGAHKNIVECFWNSAKAQICLRNTPEAIAKNFAEFIFKRHNNTNIWNHSFT